MNTYTENIWRIYNVLEDLELVNTLMYLLCHQFDFSTTYRIIARDTKLDSLTDVNCLLFSLYTTTNNTTTTKLIS